MKIDENSWRIELFDAQTRIGLIGYVEGGTLRKAVRLSDDQSVNDGKRILRDWASRQSDA